MANITTTTNAVFIPEVWSKDVQMHTEDALVMANLVKRYDSLVSKKGDTIHVPKIAERTAVAKAAGTAVTPAANTETELTYTIDQHFVDQVLIEDIANIQSNYDLMSAYTKPMGYAIAKKIDSTLTGLYSGLSQSVDASAGLTQAKIVEGIVKLGEANAPDADRFFVVKPKAYGELLNIDNFTIRNVNKESLSNGYIGHVLGVEVFVSNNIATSTTDRNLLFQRDAFVLAMQQAPRTQSEYEVSELAHRLSVDAIWGKGEYRDTFAVEVLTTT